MKSAYELAMERLAKSEPERKLTPAQKTRIAEIESLYRAKLAERETFLKGLLAKAEIDDDLTEMAQVRIQLRRDLPAIRDEWAAKKEKVWQE